MTLYDGAIARLRAQRAQLESDLALWAERASKTGDLPLHHSQVARLQMQISTALDEALRGTPVAKEGGAVVVTGTVAELPDLRRSVGTIHLLWDFFRDKLAQRDTAAYTTHLAVADDLAWACYEPFLKAVRETGNVTDQELKEPPLVFYTAERSPYAQARTKALHPPGLDSKDLEHVSAELQRLPVPVIGMPWAVVNKLPELVLVGHEAGHVVAEDLKLASELEELFAGIKLPDSGADRRKVVWTAWCDEIFADVVGVLATGTAFVSGLAAEMAGAPTEITQARIDEARPGNYPTPSLRIALCNEVLDQLDVTPPEVWRLTYGGLAGDSRAYQDDVALVATAVMEHGWSAVGGMTLRQVLPWDETREKGAAEVARAAIGRAQTRVLFDIRVWVAGAMHAALEDPGGFDAVAANTSLAQFIIARRADGVRSSRGHRADLVREASDAGAPLDTEAQLRASDEGAGRSIVDRLGLRPASSARSPDGEE